MPSFHAVSILGSDDQGTLRQYGLSSILPQLPGNCAFAECAIRLLKSRHTNWPCKLTGGFDLLVFGAALFLAFSTACQALRGERHPKLKYGDITVVEGDDTAVHEVLGFSNDAVL